MKQWTNHQILEVFRGTISCNNVPLLGGWEVAATCNKTKEVFVHQTGPKHSADILSVHFYNKVIDSNNVHAEGSEDAE